MNIAGTTIQWISVEVKEIEVSKNDKQTHWNHTV